MKTIHPLKFGLDSKIENKIQLGPNEFYNYDGKVGLVA